MERDYLRQTLRRLGTDRSEIDDLAQEVFLVLHRRWREYDASRPLRPYLFGIAFRLALAHQRKRYREEAFGTVEIGDDGPGPEEALCNKQAHALVQAALNSIPLPRRSVLVMHEFDQLPMTEIAAVLSIPLFTAYSRLRKARLDLQSSTRRMLNEKGERVEWHDSVRRARVRRCAQKVRARGAVPAAL
jgi:RNA polymerase sigma-70 factor (ECF subfamily)